MEVGHKYDKTRDSGLTNLKETIEYAKQTNIDCLAVVIGTSHGIYKEEPRLDFELLQKLNSILDVPLVLHRGSETGNDNLKRTIKTGIQKVNLFADSSKRGMQHLNAYLKGVNNEPVKSEL
ncbi:class II fructose-bisphosphate aldolase [Oceanobacillus sp. FSL W8-0428]|uniref:class II fructose-bisphosphate aldolase n=1 Tax=Oceanobacillus sp. FSL W8-0428 TaxID=2921715 RepID=UPI0030F525F6